VIDFFKRTLEGLSLHGGWRGGLSGADFGLRLGGQDEFELIEQEREFALLTLYRRRLDLSETEHSRQLRRALIAEHGRYDNRMVRFPAFTAR
jgi:hypothetical protein